MTHTQWIISWWTHQILRIKPLMAGQQSGMISFRILNKLKPGDNGDISHYLSQGVMAHRLDQSQQKLFQWTQMFAINLILMQFCKKKIQGIRFNGLKTNLLILRNKEDKPSCSHMCQMARNATGNLEDDSMLWWIDIKLLLDLDNTLITIIKPGK